MYRLDNDVFDMFLSHRIAHLSSQDGVVLGTCFRVFPDEGGELPQSG